MPPPYDAVVVGGGHNGLIASTVLAKAGLRTLVLERAERVGGAVAVSELAPGFLCPALAHRAALDPVVLRTLRLDRHGLEILRPLARVSAPTLDGRALTLWADVARATEEIALFSARDAPRYQAFLATAEAVSRVLRTVLTAPPPRIDDPGFGDLATVLRAARAFRGLARPDAYRLLRYLTMPVHDLMTEWFDSEPLSVTIGAGGTLGAFLGPRSAGGAAVLLLLGAGEGCPVAPGWTVRGGMAALVGALEAAARQAGVEIRTGQCVREILVRDGNACGVLLSDGSEVAARLVVSNLDPRRTLLELVDPLHLPPETIRRVQHIRMRGTLAKVNFAVSELPAFEGLATRDVASRAAALSGCIRLMENLDGHERSFDCAKRGQLGDNPWVELAIPSTLDQTLAPRGRHVVSAYVQFIPFELSGTTWDAERERLGDLVSRRIDTFAPGFERSVLARQVITPLDLHRTHGLTGGHIFHGELALDQLVSARPFLGWTGYQAPIRGLYLCGAGVHPGTGLDGRCGLLAAGEILKTGG